MGVTLSVVCMAILFALSACTIHYLGCFLAYFSNVLWPLAIASILAILLRPLVQWIEQRFRLNQSLSILLLYILVLGFGFFALWGVGGEVIKQSRELIDSSIDWPDRMEQKIKQSLSPATWEAISEKVHQLKKDWKQGLSDLLHGVPEISQTSARAFQDAWSGVRSFLSFFMLFAIVPIYLFYFLSSRRDYLSELVGQLGFIRSDIRQDLTFLTHQFKQILEVFFRGQLIIGLLMGIGYTLGFYLSGLKFAIALGLVFGLLNIVPFLGSVLGFLTVLAVSYLQSDGILETGQWNILLGCGLTFAIVQILESYVLSPRVMGDRTGLHPVVIIASVFFWGTAFDGLLGMILGIPLTAFLTVFWRLLRKKYLPA